jgi:replicative DNA helicase
MSATEGFAPNNIEAEKATLGSLLIDPRAIERVTGILNPVQFYLPVHQTVYGAMVELYEGDKPTDVVAVSNVLEEAGKLDDAGGPAYLAALANDVPMSMNVEYEETGSAGARFAG